MLGGRSRSAQGHSQLWAAVAQENIPGGVRALKPKCEFGLNLSAETKLQILCPS